MTDVRPTRTHAFGRSEPLPAAPRPQTCSRWGAQRLDARDHDAIIHMQWIDDSCFLLGDEVTSFESFVANLGDR